MDCPFNRRSDHTPDDGDRPDVREGEPPDEEPPGTEPRGVPSLPLVPPGRNPTYVDWRKVVDEIEDEPSVDIPFPVPPTPERVPVPVPRRPGYRPVPRTTGLDPGEQAIPYEPEEVKGTPPIPHKAPQEVPRAVSPPLIPVDQGRRAGLVAGAAVNDAYGSIPYAWRPSQAQVDALFPPQTSGVQSTNLSRAEVAAGLAEAVAAEEVGRVASAASGQASDRLGGSRVSAGRLASAAGVAGLGVAGGYLATRIGGRGGPRGRGGFGGMHVNMAQRMRQLTALPVRSLRASTFNPDL